MPKRIRMANLKAKKEVSLYLPVRNFARSNYQQQSVMAMFTEGKTAAWRRRRDARTEVKKFVESQNFAGMFRDHQVARSPKRSRKSPGSLICWRIVPKRVNASLARHRRGRFARRTRHCMPNSREKCTLIECRIRAMRFARLIPELASI